MRLYHRGVESGSGALKRALKHIYMAYLQIKVPIL